MQRPIAERDKNNQARRLNTTPIITAQQQEQLPSFDMIYLSPAHWEDEFSRFQHIAHCYAQEHRVFCIEQPVFTQGPISLSSWCFFLLSPIRE